MGKFVARRNKKRRLKRRRRNVEGILRAHDVSPKDVQRWKKRSVRSRKLRQPHIEAIQIVRAFPLPLRRFVVAELYALQPQ